MVMLNESSDDTNPTTENTSYVRMKKLIEIEERVVMILQLLTQLECVIKEYAEKSHDLHAHVYKQIVLGILYFIRYIFNNAFRAQMLEYVGKRYDNNVESLLNTIDDIIIALNSNWESKSLSLSTKMMMLRNDTSVLVYKLYSKILEAQSEYVRDTMRSEKLSWVDGTVDGTVALTTKKEYNEFLKDDQQRRTTHDRT